MNDDKIMIEVCHYASLIASKRASQRGEPDSYVRSAGHDAATYERHSLHYGQWADAPHLRETALVRLAYLRDVELPAT